MTADDFQSRYLALRRTHRRRAFAAYDEFDARAFSSIDAYCCDPDLREPDDLDAETLKSEIEQALRFLPDDAPERGPRP